MNRRRLFVTVWIKARRSCSQASAEFGYAVAGAGDVNGDGYADVLVGAWRYDGGQTDEGRAYGYYGSATGLSATPPWSVESNQAAAALGIAVGTAGDVNGDGYSDVLVGAYDYENGQADEGQGLLYYGAAAGLSATAAWAQEGNQADTYLGRAVGTAGDVNGDGYADVVIGAPGAAGGQAGLYYGDGGPGVSLTPRQRQSDDAGPIAPGGRGASATAFQLALTGRAPGGRGRVRLAWQVAPVGTPFTATTVLSGTTAWTDTLTAGVPLTQG